MSVTSYNPNAAHTATTIKHAQPLISPIHALMPHLHLSKQEFSLCVPHTSSGAMISTLSAPKTQPIEEAAYALRGAAAIGDEAYMACNAIKTCADVHPNFCRLDLPKAA